MNVSNVTGGTVSISINRAGIVSSSQQVSIPGPIAWTATPTNTPDTTAINFTFSAAPTGLVATDFTITSGTGSATRGTLSGTGTTRTLTVSNVGTGNVSISINRTGVISGSQQVAVVGPVTWTATPVGTPTTTWIDFTFSAAPTGLVEGDFSITPGTGSATRGTLSGSGTTRRLNVSNVSAGTVNVSINRAGIASGSQSVTLITPRTHTWNTATPPVGMGNGDIITIGVGASGTLVIPENATVTINSAGTGWVDNGSRAITLNISTGARIVWRANYWSTSSVTIAPTSIGTLEVAAGSIHNNSTGSAINTTSNSTIIVSGGTVSSWPQWNAAINSTGASGTVTVSGGVVRAHGNNWSPQAINVAGTLNITGGLVIAELTNATGSGGVVSRVPTNTSGTGTIIGYTLGGSHSAGGTSGLSVWPTTGANVSWGLRNTWETGINYRGNFIPRSGVSVGNRVVWDSNRVPVSASIASGSTITIAEGASGTLQVPTSVNTTIVSQGTDVVNNGNREITLNIGANSTVTWRANYTAALDHFFVMDAIHVLGTGTLNVAEGSINSTGGHRAIGTSSNIIVSGGIVSATGNNSQTINASGTSSTVTVSGGVVSATTGIAIRASGTSSTVTVSGNGVVSATTGTAIDSHASGILNITGGLVIAQRSSNDFLGANGVITRNNWNAFSGGAIARYSGSTFNAGTTTNLFFHPSGATGTWARSGTQSGINIQGMFRPVPNVTVNP
ncbi:MAG: hypothetical protein FWD87_08985 [Spirochaetaceae bacterium]|nr:hypothetical protein [Spirochaetaceae bacterium]